MGPNSPFPIFFLLPGFNFEYKLPWEGRLPFTLLYFNTSLNAEINVQIFPITSIRPITFEIGIREYIDKEFEDVYLYQGIEIALDWLRGGGFGYPIPVFCNGA